MRSSFEVATFLINKQQKSRNADAFRDFFVQLSEKEAVQNHFLTMAHCPPQSGILLQSYIREMPRAQDSHMCLSLNLVSALEELQNTQEVWCFCRMMRSFSVKISSSSRSAISNTLRSSMGNTILPSSSTLRIMPVDFIYLYIPSDSIMRINDLSSL